MGIFKKKKSVAAASEAVIVEQAPKIIGLSEENYDDMCANIIRLYSEARARQKSPDAAPSKYMQGLEAAYNVVKEYHPHEL